jgi:UDP-glucose 4-epimerase
MPNPFYRTRVLVTGGCGFIGANLVRRLVSLGAEVAVVDNLAERCGGRRENLADVVGQIELRHFDLADSAAQTGLFRDREFVFSVAGATSHVDSMRRPVVDLESNCRAHLALLEVLRRVNPDGKIVVTGTRQVYGKPQYLPVDESHPLRPVDVNGIHMQAAETYYRLYHEVYGLRSACLRLTNTYGPWMNLRNACHGFIAEFFRRALSGQSVELFGGGEQRRDLNYVDDVVEAILLAARTEMRDHETYNLGHERHQSLREIAETLADYNDFAVQRTPFPTERRRIDVGDYWGSYEKFHRATGWRPVVGLQQGIERTTAFYRRRPEEYLGGVAPAALHVEEEAAALPTSIVAAVNWKRAER